MRDSELIRGARYLCGLGFGICTIVYLGPVPLLRSYSRVMDFITRRVLWVRTNQIRPMLVSLHGGGDPQ